MWTKTPPAVDGWYWFRAPGQAPAIAQAEDGRAMFGEDHVQLADTAGWEWWTVPLTPPAS